MALQESGRFRVNLLADAPLRGYRKSEVTASVALSHNNARGSFYILSSSVPVPHSGITTWESGLYQNSGRRRVPALAVLLNR